MAEKFDVEARLADGWPAVQIVGKYVWACRDLGYQHPDLTLHDGQVRDWYASESGMDLQALQHDCIALEAAARVLQNALVVQERQLVVLSTAWQGAGADAASAVLRRHGDDSAAAAAAVRTVWETLSSLRDTLWDSVDAKVVAAMSIEGRAAGSRAEWLAAATTVTTGIGDRATSSELVHHAVRPYVESSVGLDWLTAMRTAVVSVASAYDRATAEILGESLPAFEDGGTFGGSSALPADSAATDSSAAPAVLSAGSPVPAAPNMPATQSAPTVSWATPNLPSTEAPAEPLPVPPEPSPRPGPASPEPLLSSSGPAGSTGSGLSNLGGGLSGLGQQFSDALGGLLGGAGGAVPELPGLDVPELDGPAIDEDRSDEDRSDEDRSDEDRSDEDRSDEDSSDEDSSDEEDAEGEEPELEEADGVDAEVDEDTVGEASVPAADQRPGNAGMPTAPPPPIQPLPPLPAEAAAGGRTPCEIAADELPQVGESTVSSPGQPAGR